MLALIITPMVTDVIISAFLPMNATYLPFELKIKKIKKKKKKKRFTTLIRRCAQFLRVKLRSKLRLVNRLYLRLAAGGEEVKGGEEGEEEEGEEESTRAGCRFQARSRAARTAVNCAAAGGV